MKKTIKSLFCGFTVALLFVSGAHAQTPDGETPAEETICQDESGALKGLCNAYCEAMDCNLNEAIHASPKACGRVLDNYLRKSGGTNPPCLDSGCAATAVAAANEYYVQCITSDGCEGDASCATGATKRYAVYYRSCKKGCSITCREPYNSCKTANNAEYQTCLAGAADPSEELQCITASKNRALACRDEQTACTTECIGPNEPYIAPSECPTP